MYKMYLIREYPLKIQVVCKKCSTKGYIDKKCCSCNGKGTHNNTFKVWKVQPNLIQIDDINRIANTGELRYWTDKSCYYEDSSMLVHFNNNDALKECYKRNIEKYGLEFCKQYIKY